jgi:hypothetical protein
MEPAEKERVAGGAFCKCKKGKGLDVSKWKGLRALMGSELGLISGYQQLERVGRKKEDPRARFERLELETRSFVRMGSGVHEECYQKTTWVVN